MAFVDNLPLELQSTIQQGWLEAAFDQALIPQFGFRSLATPEAYNGEVGQTVTKTKWGRLPPVRTPLPIRSNSDLDDGLTDAAYHLEQYVLGVDQYASTMTLSLASSAFSKANVFLQNAYELGRNAGESIDVLCRDAIFNTYEGGNTWVTATLGSAGLAVAVNDVRGFFQLIQPSTGKLLPVSSTNRMGVSINGNTYQLESVTADGTAPTNINFMLRNMQFSGSGSNTSTVPGGYSGVLHFQSGTNVLVADATAGNTVKSTVAPNVVRPYDPSTGVMRANTTKIVAGDVLTLRMVRNAAAKMRANSVNTPLYVYGSDQMFAPLFNDLEFRQYLQGGYNSQEFEQGVVRTAMGITFVRTNLAYPDVGATVPGVTVERAIIATNGILTEADFTNSVYSSGLQNDVSDIRLVNNVAHITRPPLNRLADVCAQSWTAYLGFTCQSDYYTNPIVTPTADYSLYKRGMILEAAYF